MGVFKTVLFFNLILIITNVLIVLIKIILFDFRGKIHCSQGRNEGFYCIVFTIIRQKIAGILEPSNLACLAAMTGQLSNPHSSSRKNLLK